MGYFSADFHGHATAYLLAEVIELHDRERVHATAFSFGPPSQGPMRERPERAFDEFIDVSRLSDAAIAALSRERGIDIAIDLKGLTQDSRPGIFAARAAPVQVNYLGHPGTLGAPFVDFLVADETILPRAHEAHYTERVLRMPDCYQPNDRRRPIAPQAPGREALGLPAQGFVFCCFNATYKLSPDVFAVWMRLLARVESSVLWLMRAPESAMGRLRAAASAAGVDPARLVFAAPLDLPFHLARLREADLFLDTFHCGAHTTASDALWAGVPLVTRLGETFASRIAASLLRAAGLADLVTDSTAAYEALAHELARSGNRLAELRRRLATRGHESPLFDTPRYTRELEALYLAMA